MSRSTSKLGKLIRKSLRFFGFFLLFIFVSVNLFILLSGRLYLYKGIWNTYLQGKTGPGIYDKDVFASSSIGAADSVYQWKNVNKSSQINWDHPDFTLLKKNQTTSFLVFKGDSLLIEKYWGDHQQNTVSNSFSAAKTFVALLVGIAWKEGKIKSLDDSVGKYIPEFQSDDKKGITIRHLLMMSSGLDWEESGKNPLSENAESYYGSDLYGLVTRQKRIEKPGVKFNYQSGNSQLLAYVVEKATGKDLSAYAHEKIWSQIGTEADAFWSLDKKNGDEKAFCCMYATSRDFGRLGKLILQEGIWEGKEIVPVDFMREMVQNPPMTTEEGVPNLRYGLHIWTYHGMYTPVYYCRGILGQYIISIPSENLVIIRTGKERAKNYEIPENKKKDADFVKKNQAKVGHPSDLFDYISLAKKYIH